MDMTSYDRGGGRALIVGSFRPQLVGGPGRSMFHLLGAVGEEEGERPLVFGIAGTSNEPALLGWAWEGGAMA